MARVEIADPFTSNEESVEVDPQTLELLKKRIRTASEGRTVGPEEARNRIREWLSNSDPTKTR